MIDCSAERDHVSVDCAFRVTGILDLLSAGASIEEILEDYPDLEREGFSPRFEYAARQTDHAVLRSA